jgi:hypothetical protein
MSYYPKSQIKIDLYTNGEEFLLSPTNIPYKGYYYETSNNTKYSGKHPGDGFNHILIPISEFKPGDIDGTPDKPNQILILSQPLETYPDTPNSNVEYFNSLNNISPQPIPNRFLPQFNPTTPTSKDYTLGSFTRYFCKKTNELKYIEINKETHDKLKVRDKQIAWDLYEPQFIVWQINGDREGTFLANKNNIALLEKRQKWYGFSQYLKEDYLKYYLAS